MKSDSQAAPQIARADLVSFVRPLAHFSQSSKVLESRGARIRYSRRLIYTAKISQVQRYLPTKKYLLTNTGITNNTIQD
jgi:hypothetical protein